MVGLGEETTIFVEDFRSDGFPALNQSGVHPVSDPE